MLKEITSKQLTEWMAFYKLEPFGFEAQIYGHAITSSVIANSHRKKGVKAFQPFDFMPKEKELPSVRSFFANLKAMLSVNQHNQRKREKRP